MSDVLGKAVAHFEADRTVPVEVPEWGTTVHVRKLSLRQEWKLDEEKNASRRVARTVIVSAMDEKGEPLFPDNVDTLAKLEGAVCPDLLLRIARAARGRTVEQAKNA